MTERIAARIVSVVLIIVFAAACWFIRIPAGNSGIITDEDQHYRLGVIVADVLLILGCIIGIVGGIAGIVFLIWWCASAGWGKGKV